MEAVVHRDRFAGAGLQFPFACGGAGAVIQGIVALAEALCLISYVVGRPVRGRSFDRLVRPLVPIGGGVAFVVGRQERVVLIDLLQQDGFVLFVLRNIVLVPGFVFIHKAVVLVHGQLRIGRFQRHCELKDVGIVITAVGILNLIAVNQGRRTLDDDLVIRACFERRGIRGFQFVGIGFAPVQRIAGFHGNLDRPRHRFAGKTEAEGNIILRCLAICIRGRHLIGGSAAEIGIRTQLAEIRCGLQDCQHGRIAVNPAVSGVFCNHAVLVSVDGDRHAVEDLRRNIGRVVPPAVVFAVSSVKVLGITLNIAAVIGTYLSVRDEIVFVCTLIQLHFVLVLVTADNADFVDVFLVVIYRACGEEDLLAAGVVSVEVAHRHAFDPVILDACHVVDFIIALRKIIRQKYCRQSAGIPGVQRAGEEYLFRRGGTVDRDAGDSRQRPGGIRSVTGMIFREVIHLHRLQIRPDICSALAGKSGHSIVVLVTAVNVAPFGDVSACSYAGIARHDELVLAVRIQVAGSQRSGIKDPPGRRTVRVGEKIPQIHGVCSGKSLGVRVLIQHCEPRSGKDVTRHPHIAAGGSRQLVLAVRIKVAGGQGHGRHKYILAVTVFKTAGCGGSFPAVCICSGQVLFQNAELAALLIRRSLQGKLIELRVDGIRTGAIDNIGVLVIPVIVTRCDGEERMVVVLREMNPGVGDHTAQRHRRGAQVFCGVRHPGFNPLAVHIVAHIGDMVFSPAAGWVKTYSGHEGHACGRIFLCNRALRVVDVGRVAVHAQRLGVTHFVAHVSLLEGVTHLLIGNAAGYTVVLKIEQRLVLLAQQKRLSLPLHVRICRVAFDESRRRRGTQNTFCLSGQGGVVRLHRATQRRCEAQKQTQCQQNGEHSLFHRFFSSRKRLFFQVSFIIIIIFTVGRLYV